MCQWSDMSSLLGRALRGMMRAYIKGANAMEKPHMSRHARILILASILSACTDKAALQARDAEIVALKGQLAAMEARTAAAEKRITAVREGHRPTFDPIQDAPTPVQDGLRYLEAMERFTIADWQTANLPSSRRLTSEKLGCGSVLCPSDYDLLHLAEKAAAPTPATSAPCSTTPASRAIRESADAPPAAPIA